MLLYFCTRGETYKVNEKGEMTQSKNNDFSGHWLFLGVSFHHWKRSIDRTFQEIWESPARACGGLVWDLDCGTTRVWGGNYHGRLPRIQRAWKGE